jgi:hypothetical protein
MNTYKVKAISALVLYALMILAAIFMGSCRTPQWKHDRLVHLYGDELCSIDTIVIKDTIVRTVKIPVPEYRDSFIFKTDTTYETKEVFIYKKGDRVYLRVKPKEIEHRDTIPFEVKVPGPVIEKKIFEWWYLLVAFLVGMVIAYRFRS